MYRLYEQNLRNQIIKIKVIVFDYNMQPKVKQYSKFKKCRDITNIGSWYLQDNLLISSGKSFSYN